MSISVPPPDHRLSAASVYSQPSFHSLTSLSTCTDHNNDDDADSLFSLPSEPDPEADDEARPPHLALIAHLESLLDHLSKTNLTLHRQLAAANRRADALQSELNIRLAKERRRTTELKELADQIASLSLSDAQQHQQQAVHPSSSTSSSVVRMSRGSELKILLSVSELSQTPSASAEEVHPSRRASRPAKPRKSPSPAARPASPPEKRRVPVVRRPFVQRASKLWHAPAEWAGPQADDKPKPSDSRGNGLQRALSASKFTSDSRAVLRKRAGSKGASKPPTYESLYASDSVPQRLPSVKSSTSSSKSSPTVLASSPSEPLPSPSSPSSPHSPSVKGSALVRLRSRLSGSRKIGSEAPKPSLIKPVA